MFSRILFTATALAIPIGSHLADYSRAHIFNPKWPPHAKFHTGQTLSFSVLLCMLTIWLSWRKTTDYKTALISITTFDLLY